MNNLFASLKKHCFFLPASEKAGYCFKAVSTLKDFSSRLMKMEDNTPEEYIADAFRSMRSEAEREMERWYHKADAYDYLQCSEEEQQRLYKNDLFGEIEEGLKYIKEDETYGA